VTGAAAIVIVTLRLTLPALFVAVTVKVKLPAAVGVPESTPVLVFSDSPLGRPPVCVHVGAGLPVAVKVKLYALPTVPLGGLPEVIAGAVGAEMVIVTLLLALPSLFVAVTVKVKLPAAVGVPESTPVLVLKVKPLGKFPVCDQVGAGVPVAANVKLYEMPTVPLGGLPEVITGSGPTIVIGLNSALIVTSCAGIRKDVLAEYMSKLASA